MKCIACAHTERAPTGRPADVKMRGFSHCPILDCEDVVMIFRWQVGQDPERPTQPVSITKKTANDTGVPHQPLTYHLAGPEVELYRGL